MHCLASKGQGGKWHRFTSIIPVAEHGDDLLEPLTFGSINTDAEKSSVNSSEGSTGPGKTTVVAQVQPVEDVSLPPVNKHAPGLNVQQQQHGTSNEPDSAGVSPVAESVQSVHELPLHHTNSPASTLARMDTLSPQVSDAFESLLPSSNHVQPGSRSLSQ